MDSAAGDSPGRPDGPALAVIRELMGPPVLLVSGTHDKA
jgi:hypothetical protein